MVLPSGDGLVVFGQHIELTERGTLPVYGTQQDGNDVGLAGLVPLDGTLDFEVVAGVVGDRVGADQQQNDIGGVELLVDGLGAIVTGENLVAAPATDDVMAFEQGEMVGQLGLQIFVGGGI